MKSVSSEEFEQYIIEIIEGKRSQKQTAKELETDLRTFYKAIQKLSITNPELYCSYVKACPYKPKESKNVKAIDLAYEVLKGEKTMQQIADDYGTSVRTMRRRIDTLKTSEDPIERELYDVCKEICYNNMHSQKNSLTVEEKAQELRNILKDKISKEKLNNVEEKRRTMAEAKAKYDEYCKTMTKDAAAKKVGWNTYSDAYKKLKQLERIEKQLEVIEKDKQKSSTSQKDSFNTSLRADISESKPEKNESSSNTKKIETNDKSNTDREL